MILQGSRAGLSARVKTAILASLLVLTLASPRQTFAWGNSGHEAVAWVAWQQLTPATQKRVMQLLAMVPTLQNSAHTKSIPGYKDWVNDLPPGLSTDDQNLYLFMRAATWADTIKHEWLQDSDTPPKNSPPSEPAKGYTDTASHGYWHFVDDGFASDKSTVPATPAPNAATQIVELRTAIAVNDASVDLLKSYELVWLLHLVGDIHQPLHGAVRFFNNQGDEGGNTVKITMPTAMKKQFEGTLSKSAPTELHAFWDDLPGEGAPAPALPFAVTFAKTLSPADQASVSDTDPNDWAQESLSMAKKDAYHSPIGKSPAPTSGSSYSITQAYYNTAMQDAKVRIALAGARLAKLLNENLH
ncbi:MAG TPA: S1/P1 nuclease [Verrucomicrobiae bacterium]|nr:S1/P1 nuclease [Verrucomicrobiae bacterium]